VTASLEEVRAMLIGAADHIGSARGHAAAARTRIDEAVGVLQDLAAGHSEPLVPPALLRAADELDRGLGLIGAGESRVADITARL
jgi:hypothetical protein